MASPELKHRPHPGEVWLSCPPYLLLARIVEVDDRRAPAMVSYELHDDDGSVLDRVNHATLDRGWWQSFQPLERHYG